MTMDFRNLADRIEATEIITIFRHSHPDCDAMGSQCGLAQWIKDNYPLKQVYMLGNEVCNQTKFPSSDCISDELIAQSLAIVTDTANQARVDDSRFTLAKELIKIDHHPDREHFGDPCLVFPENAATCEILAQFFQDCAPEKVVSKQTAEYLMKGILTDTLSFRTSNTTGHTLAVASYLAQFGLNLAELNRELFDSSLEAFTFANFLRENVNVLDGRMAYIILDKETLDRWSITPGNARNFIDQYGHVKEFLIWAIFTEREEGIYDGSLRSKTVTINDIAEVYNGGGHKNASGVKDLSLKMVNELILILNNKLNS